MIGGSGLEPIRWFAYAQVGQSFLNRSARDLALGFPSIDGAAGPRLGLTVPHTELRRAERRLMRFTPLTEFIAGQVHSGRVSF
jgi:hypothetical protein